MRILSKKDLLRLVSNDFFLSRSWNSKQHSLGFLQDIVIADPEHLKSLLLLEESFSLRILLPPLIMTSPIDLDDEADFVAEEIHDVGTDRLLAVEFQSGETPTTQAVPQPPLGDCCVSAQSPCVFSVRRDGSSV